MTFLQLACDWDIHGVLFSAEQFLSCCGLRIIQNFCSALFCGILLCLWPFAWYPQDNGCLATDTSVVSVLAKTCFFRVPSLIQHNLAKRFRLNIRKTACLPEEWNKIHECVVEFPSREIFGNHQKNESWGCLKYIRHFPTAGDRAQESPRCLPLGLLFFCGKGTKLGLNKYLRNNFWRTRNPSHRRIYFTVIYATFANIRRRLLNFSNLP